VRGGRRWFGQPRAEMLGEFMAAFRPAARWGEYDDMKGYLERSFTHSSSAERATLQSAGFGKRQARILLEEGRRARSGKPCCERALSICRGRGDTVFVGPIVNEARSAGQSRGAEMGWPEAPLDTTIFWYHRDAIEAFLGARDPKGMMPHVEAARGLRAVAEPLPWSTLFAGARPVVSPARPAGATFRDGLFRGLEGAVRG